MAADRSPAQVQRPGSDTVDAAMAWLRTQTSPRFFLFLHLYEPHKPWRAPDRFADLDAYDGEVAFSDELTGSVVDRAPLARLVRRRHGDRPLGSWRGPRRSHRGGARPVSLRRSHPGALGDEAARTGESRHARPGAGSAHRPAADAGGDVRPEDSAGGPVADATCRRFFSGAVRSRRRGSTPRRSTRAITSAGASCCR